MIKYYASVLLTLGICGACLAAEVPKAEYSKDAHTLFLCHFNSAEEVKALEGTVGDGVKFVTGKFGNGVQIEQKSDFIAFPTAGKFNQDQGTIEMTVKSLVNLADLKYPLDQPPYLLHMYKNDNNWVGLSYNNHNKTISMGIWSDQKGAKANCVAQAGVKWSAGEWHHVATSWGNGATNLYIDGKLVATQKYDAGMCTMPDTFCVGNTAWRRNPAKMVIDEMRILDIPLDFNKAEDW